MIETYIDSKYKSTMIILVVNFESEGVYDWEGYKGYLISGVTSQTPSAAVDKYIELCKKNEDALLALNKALWATPPGEARAKPSRALEKLKTALLKEAGIKDS